MQWLVTEWNEYTLLLNNGTCQIQHFLGTNTTTTTAAASFCFNQPIFISK